MKKLLFMLIILSTPELHCAEEVSQSNKHTQTSLQSIFDTIANNALVKSTVDYIKSAINQFMVAIGRPVIEQIPANENITFNDYNGTIPDAALELVNQLKNRETYLLMG